MPTERKLLELIASGVGCPQWTAGTNASFHFCHAEASGEDICYCLRAAQSIISQLEKESLNETESESFEAAISRL